MANEEEGGKIGLEQSNPICRRGYHDLKKDK